MCTIISLKPMNLKCSIKYSITSVTYLLMLSGEKAPYGKMENLEENYAKT